MKLLVGGLRAVRDNKWLLVGMSLLSAFRACIADWAVVPSSSMNPMLIEGDYILVNRSTYGVYVPITTVWLKRGSGPRCGGVVVLSSLEDGTKLVKRLIRLPGDVVEMRDGALYINCQCLVYVSPPDAAPGTLPQVVVMLPHELWSKALPGRQHTVMVLPEVRALRSFGPIIVPQDCHLMLGDNRDSSRDSRYFGLAPCKNSIARASHLALSFDPDHLYMPCLARIGKSPD